jgi:hypothetical protein
MAGNRRPDRGSRPRAAAALSAAAALALGASMGPASPAPPASRFETSEACVACHTGLVTTSGEDVSFDTTWRTSMMANSARDPYWHASVRREVTDHPESQAAIEDECSACHMPMMRHDARAAGHEGRVFDHLAIAGLAPAPAGSGTAGHGAAQAGAPHGPGRPASVVPAPAPKGQARDASGARSHADAAAARLALDGVSCTVCHQIAAEGLGSRESFNGGFRLAPVASHGARPVFGPFEIDAGRARIMRSSSTFEPAAAEHLRSSELCATCHTLITQALGPGGTVIGELPEQVPFLEWQHSAWRGVASCQTCHMPVVEEPIALTRVLGQPRTGVARHTFHGGNFFMQRMLARAGGELGVEAGAGELDAAAQATGRFLATQAAGLAVRNASRDGTRLTFEVAVASRTGHKLPSAYPSRRAWLHVTVREAGGTIVFESGALQPDGSIAGNDNDADPARFEPHHETIERADAVQIYETVMVDARGAVTTGLLSAVGYVKDNRLLPEGFDKATARPEVAVHGGATDDPDFTGGGDTVRYRVPVGAAGPLEIDVELLYQPIGYRWAKNLARYDTPESRRFLRLYDEMARVSAARLAHATLRVP